VKRKIIAWSVHIYTVAGGLIGLAALIAAAQGNLHTSFMMLMATVFIDSTDGTLARRAHIKQVLPDFDGSEVDNVIDFFTYVWIPVFIMWKAELLPHPILLGVPVVAALYAYGQVNMKSNEGYFIGFPSYWNIIALYLFWLHPAPVLAALMVLVPGILSFVPTRYLYPSRGGPLWRITYVLTALWLLLVLVLLFQTQPMRALILLSLLYPVYYMVASFYVEIRTRRASRGALANVVISG
jgi:phosphatidylcholine synthase